MTYEDAKRFILANWFDGDDNVRGVDGNYETMAMKMAVEALDKQIPKKPYAKTEFYGACPSCGRTIDTEFCQYCGQAIDWGEVE